MWETPFDLSLLDTEPQIIVNCPTEDAERKLASILAERGITYLGGKSPVDVPSWSDYQEKFCYFINGKSLYRGVKSDTDIRSWSSSFKCTFSDIEFSDFDIATDNELQSLLGI